MKLEVFKNEDGSWNIVVRRTRPKERPTQSAENVAQQDYDTTVARLVALVAPPEG